MIDLHEGWIETRLADIIATANTGLDAIKRAPIVIEDTGIRCFRIQDASQSKEYIRWGFTNVNQQNYDKFKLLTGDILIARTGNSIGVNFLVRHDTKAVFNNGLIRLRVNEFVRYDFLYKIISSHVFDRYIQSIAYGTSTQPNMQINSLLNFNLLLPPLPEQKSIANILSSFDEKIELLREQNKTLETLAQTIFNELLIKESHEEWNEVSLEDITERITDGAHKSPKTVETGFPMASVKDMYQWGINIDSCRKISEKDFAELIKADCQPLKDDILIAKDGSYLKHVFIAEENMDVVILSSIAILRTNGKYAPLLLKTYLTLESTKKGLENIVSGAVIPRIVLKDFRKFKLRLPPKIIQDKVLACIQPLHGKCLDNNRQIQTLTKTRDTLLPKLMSGEVRVNS